MADAPISVRLAQAVGITTSAFLSGFILSVSAAAVPPLLQAPAPLLLRQWRTLFNQGKAIAPPLAISSFLALAYVSAYYHHHAAAPWGELLRSKLVLNSLAGLATVGIVPYTTFVMDNVNSKLMAKAEQLQVMSPDQKVEAAEERNAHALLDQWATLNVGRVLLPLLGSILASWVAFT